MSFDHVIVFCVILQTAINKPIDGHCNAKSILPNILKPGFNNIYTYFKFCHRIISMIRTLEKDDDQNPEQNYN